METLSHVKVDLPNMALVATGLLVVVMGIVEIIQFFMRRRK